MSTRPDLIGEIHSEVERRIAEAVDAARREERELCIRDVRVACGGDSIEATATIFRINERARSTADAVPKSLLRAASEKYVGGCYCKPGRCMAPVVMGRQQPCLDPAKASLCPHCALPQMNCDCMPARSTPGGKPAEPDKPKPRAHICCLKCGRLMSVRYCDLWSPDDPVAKVKCDKCGAWSTLAELNLVGKQAEPVGPTEEKK